VVGGQVIEQVGGAPPLAICNPLYDADRVNLGIGLDRPLLELRFAVPAGIVAAVGDHNQRFAPMRGFARTSCSARYTASISAVLPSA